MGRSALKALACIVESAVSTCSLSLGRAAHAQIIKTLSYSLPPLFMSNHLVYMYAKLNLSSSAELVLSLTPDRSVVTWSSLIVGCVHNGHHTAAVAHFVRMLNESIQPNDFTFPCVLKALGALRWLSTGKLIHGIALKFGQISDVIIGCSVFDMYSRIGLRDDACNMFDEMPERNIVIWNAYISHSVADGHPLEAVSAFVEFLHAGGNPDRITFCALLNACSDTTNVKLGQLLHGFVIRSGNEGDVSVANGLIDFYGKCQSVQCAEMVFRAIPVRNAVSWCSMIAIYQQNSNEAKALKIFIEARKRGIELSDFMLSSVLSACSAFAILELGRSIHSLAVKACVFGSVFVGSALVDMYGKCGSIEDAEQAFYGMPVRNLVSWNAMIGSYAHLGLANKAIALLNDMLSRVHEVRPNYITMVCVLSACSRAGSVMVGMKFFEMMSNLGIDPQAEHYACVVDMLGRCGMLEQAYEFINKMPVSPTAAVWGALLGACRVHGHPILGRIAASKLLQVDPQDSSNCVLLSNTFAAAGRWDEAAVARQEMNRVAVIKGTGCSWIAVKNALHVFQSKDASHEMNVDIQVMLAKLRKDMKVAGYVPGTNLALFDLEGE